MNITLIQPRLGIQRVKGSMAPLAMGILAQNTPSHYKIRLIDESIEDIPAGLSTDLVALSVTTLTAKRAYDLSVRFMEKGIPVVMGGVHPTLMQDEAMRYATTVISGVGENIWPNVLEDAAKGQLKKIYVGTESETLSGLTPDRKIFENKRYSLLTPVQFGRGCPFTCDFCSVHAFYGDRVVHRPVDEVLEEVRQLKGKLLFFVDDNINGYGKGTLELLEGLARMRIKWFGQASINAANNTEMLNLLKKSGCMGLIVGFESLNENSLGQMNKAVNLRHNYKDAVQKFQNAGIMISGAFVFGYDSDTANTVENASIFARKNKLVHAYFNPILPTPGTELYQRLKADNRFPDPIWWLSESYMYGQIPFIPKEIQPRELEQACKKARWKFDTLGSMVVRYIGGKANRYSIKNSIFYWMANILYRMEYRRKYGRRMYK